MAKKEEKVQGTKNVLGNDFFTELTKETDFKVAETGSLMHSRVKVKTPLAVLNCIYGGGIPLGILSEVSGVTKSGKSTFLYQCMGNYQKQYPDGIAVILDMEASMDNDRLEALGVDPSRVLRLPASTIEGAFSNLFKLFNKLVGALDQYEDLSMFCIYDSLAAGGTDSEQEAAHKGESTFGAGTMREDTRVLKHNLMSIFPYMEKFPIFMGFINQVFVHPNPYGGPAKVKSGGGNALKHLCHEHLVFSDPKDDLKGTFLVGTESKLSLEKSKLSPKMMNIPCYIDVTKGGRINEAQSFVEYLTDKSIGLITSDAWCKFGMYLKLNMFSNYPELGNKEELKTILEKSYRKDDVYKLVSENEDLFNFLQIALIDFLCDIYPAQKIVTDDFKAELISKCKYFIS